MKTNFNKEYDLENISARIKKLIYNSQFNNTETAEKLNITVQALSNIVNGKALPATKTLIKMAELFNVTIDFILTGKESTDNNPFYQYKKVIEEAHQKIKDMEPEYQTGQVNKILKELDVHPENKNKYLTMMKIIYILTFKPHHDKEFHDLWNQLPDDSQQTLLNLDKKILNNILKKASK